MSGTKSWGVSLLIGLGGAALGYLIFTVGLGIGDTDVFDFGGIIGAILGVVIVLVIAGAVMKNRGGPTTHPEATPTGSCAPDRLDRLVVLCRSHHADVTAGRIVLAPTRLVVCRVRHTWGVDPRR